MVPMLTCGLVRSNFAFATGVLLSHCGWSRSLRWCCGLGLLAPDLLDDLLRDVAWNLGVGVELHGVDGPALGLAAEVADVAEHLGQGHDGADHLGPADVLHR